MPYSYPLRAGLGLLGLMLGACTTAPPGPLGGDHPASIHAPMAPVEPEPSALSAYRDFTAAAQPDAKTPGRDHSMHRQHEQDAASPAQSDREEPHANHQ
jgi:hypothetical protein